MEKFTLKTVQWFQSLRDHLTSQPSRAVALLLFLTNLLLVHPQFFPSLNEINPFDESVYINGGRLLLDQGKWSPYASNPLVDVFYALTYLPFRASPFWLIQSCSLGRLLLFTLLWLSAYLVATQLTQFFPPVMLLGLLFVAPLTVDMLTFPSDPLFASLAGLSFWQLILFYNTRKNKHLWLASLFLGLAAMARNDGLLLFPILAALVLFLSWRTRGVWVNLLATTLPILLIVGGYTLVYGLFTGDYELGIMRRTYDNFEAGQEAIYRSTGLTNPTVEAKIEARKIFGTPKENNYSIFNAIRRNPGVYFQRLLVTVKNLPTDLLHAYGIRFAVPLFLLAIRGIVELFKQKQHQLLALLCLWPAHLVTGFAITIFRPGHLGFPYYVVFSLAAIGLAALLHSLPDQKEILIWFALLFLLGLVGIAGNKLAVYYGALILLAVLVILYLLLRNNILKSPQDFPVLLLILLCAGIILRGGYPSPVFRSLGVTAKEQAVVFMEKQLEPGSKVASGSPGPVWAAKMDQLSLTAADFPYYKNSDELLAWLKKNDVRAIYVDQQLYGQAPAVWALIKAQIGKGLRRVFSGDLGDVQVLVFNP